MITRVTQRMLVGRELTSVEGGALRMANAQEQMTTGRRINRISDAPADLSVALKARSGLSQNAQFTRNGQDATARLSTIDTALTSITTQVQRGYAVAVAGANQTNTQQSLNADADEIDQIVNNVLGLSNTTYLGTPVFGGTTTGSLAYQKVTNSDGTTSVEYIGDNGTVSRRIGDDNIVRVDSAATSVFGKTQGTNSDGTSVATGAGTSIFDHLQALSKALRAGDFTAISAAQAQLKSDTDQLGAAAADEGARMNQVTAATNVAADTTLALQTTQTNVEDVDIAQATINFQTTTTAYQSALMAVSKTSQQSLLNFLS